MTGKITELTAELNKLNIGYLHLVETDGPGAAAEDAPPDAFLAARHPLFARLREVFDGPLIVNGGYDGGRGETVLASGAADLVAYGKWFLANPDLPLRLGAASPLNAPDKATFYGGGAEGYTDYPFLSG